MTKPIAIIGHGLSGTVLALNFFQRHIPFQLFGKSISGEASIASSGIIAPITGRRYVKAWDIDQYIETSLEFYRWTESLFGQHFFEAVEIVRFLSNEEARKAWQGRLQDQEYGPYISAKQYPFLEKFDKPYGIVTGGYQLDTQSWLDAAHAFLQEKGLLTLGDNFVAPEDVPNSICILATGAMDPGHQHGIIPNKGEALVVRMEDWDVPLIVKDEVYIVPLKNGHYWVGSYYERWPATVFPTEEGRKQISASIAKIYSGHLEIVDHIAGVRPTVDDRRPLIGPYPGTKDVYWFNGMGTKATSLTPYWSQILISHLMEGLSLPKEVSPSRYH